MANRAARNRRRLGIPVHDNVECSKNNSEENGNRSDLPAQQYQSPQPGASHLPVFAAQLGNRPSKQAWSMDTTYVPMKSGFIYLPVLLDWAARKALAWRISNGLTPKSCLEALEEALMKYGATEIMNTDQGSQFASSSFISVVDANDIAMSVDGKG